MSAMINRNVDASTLLSGATSGVVGELAADSAYQEGQGSFSKSGAIAIGQVAGAGASLFSSLATGASDSETANNLQLGSYIGSNAAMNNAVYIGGKVKIPGSDKITGEGNDYDLNSGIKFDWGIKTTSFGTDGENTNITIPSLGAGGYINLVPHASNTLATASYNYSVPGVLFLDAIQTDRGMGLGVTLGGFLTPLAKIGVTIKQPKTN